MPDKVGFEPLGPSTYGVYDNSINTVDMNSNFDFRCFYNMEELKKEMKKHHHYIVSDDFSSKHPAHAFVHEYSHSAHWHHLENRNGTQNAKKVWEGLVGTTVPSAIGRLITHFKLGDYAVDGDDMCEFLAERMTQDICKGLTENMWVPYKDIDVGYSDVFSRKWNYRYSCPQAYLDYFTQQVWNGDIEEAKRAGGKVEQYLAELETQKVSPLVEKVASAIDYTPVGMTEEEKPLLFKIGSFFSRKLRSANESTTNYLDNKNKLKINI